jgi:hypothetical protein
MWVKPCNRNAAESFPVPSLESREQKPPNHLLIQDKDVLQPTSAPGALKNTSLAWEVRLTWPHEAKFVRIDYLGSGGGSINTADISVVSEGAVPTTKAEVPTMPKVKEPPKPAPAPAPATQSCKLPADGNVPPEVMAYGNGNRFYVSTNGDDSISCQQAMNTGTPGPAHMTQDIYGKKFFPTL